MILYFVLFVFLVDRLVDLLLVRLVPLVVLLHAAVVLVVVVTVVAAPVVVVVNYPSGPTMAVRHHAARI